MSDIRLPGSVRAVVLDFFNCNAEVTGTDPEPTHHAKVAHEAHSHYSTIPLSETDVTHQCLRSSSGLRASDLHCENFSLGRERGLTFWQRQRQIRRADRSVQRAQRCGANNQREQGAWRGGDVR